MNIKRLAIVFLSVLTLTSCGPLQPEYRTDYQLVAPPTENGRMCANNCLMMQQNCRQSCALQSQQCQMTDELRQRSAQYDADRAFAEYVDERKAQGKLIKKKRDDFYDGITSSCDANSCPVQCANDYHMCHTNCGGQVIPHTVCVANCNMPQPGMQ